MNSLKIAVLPLTVLLFTVVWGGENVRMGEKDLKAALTVAGGAKCKCEKNVLGKNYRYLLGSGRDLVVFLPDKGDATLVIEQDKRLLQSSPVRDALLVGDKVWKEAVCLIRADMPTKEILAIMAAPARDIASGTSIFEWTTTTGEKFALHEGQRMVGDGSRFITFTDATGHSEFLTLTQCNSSGVPASTVPAQSDQQANTAVASTIESWQRALAERVKVGGTVASVETFMAGKFREKTRYVFGGTGNFNLLYLVDDVLQIRVSCTGQETVADVPIVERKWLWLRRPDGILWAVPPQPPVQGADKVSKDTPGP